MHSRSFCARFHHTRSLLCCQHVGCQVFTTSPPKRAVSTPSDLCIPALRPLLPLLSFTRVCIPSSTAAHRRRRSLCRAATAVLHLPHHASWFFHRRWCKRPHGLLLCWLFGLQLSGVREWKEGQPGELREIGFLPFPVDDVMCPGETKALHLYEVPYANIAVIKVPVLRVASCSSTLSSQVSTRPRRWFC